MEERWWPLVWLVGAFVGYGLFMWQHPLRSSFGIAFEFARNNLTLVAGLALLLVGAVGWRSWQETGLGSDNTVALSVGQWTDLLHWVPYAVEDLRAVFWYCVPVDVAFVLGTPLACLTGWYWMPRLWRACQGRWRWLAIGTYVVYGLALWWWAQRMCEVLQIGAQPVPQSAFLRGALSWLGESVFAVIMVCFVQSVLLLGAYRSHGSGNARCQLKEAVDWALKFFPRMAFVPLLVLLAWGGHAVIANRIDPAQAALWDAVSLVVLLFTSAVPICVLLLQDLLPWEAFRASLRFLLRTAWLYVWFVFLCLTHFFLLRLAESYLLASVLTHETAVIAWYLVAALIRAALVMWFVNAFCLYFCIDVSKRRQKGRASKSSPRPMKLAILQAKVANKPKDRRRFFFRS